MSKFKTDELEAENARLRAALQKLAEAAARFLPLDSPRKDKPDTRPRARRVAIAAPRPRSQ
jgi:hypothetical protein